jgi:hypothetical protein
MNLSARAEELAGMPFGIVITTSNLQSMGAPDGSIQHTWLVSAPKANQATSVTQGMKRILLFLGSMSLAMLVLLNLVFGWVILPPILLNALMPPRTEAERGSIRAVLCPPGCTLTSETLAGGEPAVLMNLRAVPSIP